MATLDVLEEYGGELGQFAPPHPAVFVYFPVPIPFIPEALESGSASSAGDEGGGVPPQYIRGTVLDIDQNPVARTVIAIDRATGLRVALGASDGSGNFVLRPRTLDPCILVAVPLDGEQLNAVVLDNVTPVPI